MLMVVMVVIMGNADVVLVLMAMVKLVAEVFVMREMAEVEVLLTVIGKVVALLVVVIEKSVALAIVSPEAAGTSDMLEAVVVVVVLVIPAKISVLVVVKE